MTDRAQIIADLERIEAEGVAIDAGATSVLQTLGDGEHALVRMYLPAETQTVMLRIMREMMDRTDKDTQTIADAQRLLRLARWHKPETDAFPSGS